jgi:hypothetical protein
MYFLRRDNWMACRKDSQGNDYGPTMGMGIGAAVAGGLLMSAVDSGGYVGAITATAVAGLARRSSP